MTSGKAHLLSDLQLDELIKAQKNIMKRTDPGMINSAEVSYLHVKSC